MIAGATFSHQTTQTSSDQNVVGAKAALRMACAGLFILLAGALRMHGAGDPQLSWSKANGPWGTDFEGNFGTIAVQPGNPNVLLVGCSVLGPGVFKSTDGGSTWTAKNAGIQALGVFTTQYRGITKIVFAPSNPNIVYLGTATDDPILGIVGEIYRSSDGGESWQKACGPAIFLSETKLHGAVYDLDIHPQDPDTVYAGVAGQGVMKTTNGGGDWSVVFSATTTSSTGATDYFNIVRVDPGNPNTVFFEGFTYYFENALAWLPTKSQDDTTGTEGLVPFPLRKSTDGGANWRSVSPVWPLYPVLGPWLGVRLPGLITDLRFAGTGGGIYISTHAYQTPAFLPVFNYGIFQSVDGGEGWTAINLTDFGNIDQWPLVALTANASGMIFASTGLGGLVLGSIDGGLRWFGLNPGLSNAYVGATELSGGKLFILTSQGIYSSDVSSLSVPAAPIVTSVTPAALAPSGSTQPVTILGNNFVSTGATSDSRLVFYDPAGNPTPQRTPVFVDASRLDYNAVFPVTGQWQVKVVNGALESLPFTFAVTAPGAQLTGLSITGPAAVGENNSAQFTATASFSDGTTATVTSSAVWGVNVGTASISVGGLLSAGSVGADTTATVSASYSVGGITKSTTGDITIINSAGGGGSQTTDVIVNGSFEAGKAPWAPNGSADIVSLTYPHSPGTWYAYLCNANNALGAFSQFFPIPASTTSATLSFYVNIVTAETSSSLKFDTMEVGLLTGSDQLAGKIVTLSNLDKGTNTNGSYVLKSYDISSLIAQYSGQSLYLYFNGSTDSSNSTIFRIDDVKLLITSATPVSLTGLSISGESSVPEGRGTTYLAKAIFSDGTTQTVSPNSWSEDSAITTISTDGFLSAGSVAANTSVNVTASYTFNGATKQASKAVTVTDTTAPHTLDSLALSGPAAMAEGDAAQFKAIAVFGDGTSNAVVPVWSVSSASAGISVDGVIAASAVVADTTVTVTASYNTGGITRSASQDVLILNRPDAPALASLAISGANVVPAGGAAPYTATASFADGSSQVVYPQWSVDSPAATMAGSGLLSVGNSMASDTPATVSASYTVGGVTKVASQSITLSAAVVPVSRVISLGGTLTFGDTPVGSTKTDTLIITNLGNATLTVSSITFPTGFSGNWTTGDIAPGGAQTVAITFSPSLAGNTSATIAVISNATGGAGTIAASGNGVSAPIFVNGPAPAAAIVGQPYIFSYQVTGNPAPTYTVLSGSLPPGLTLSSSGVLSGTPTTTGTYLSVAQAANGILPTAVQNCQIVVTAGMSFSAWVATHFTVDERADPAVSGPNAAPSSDGLPNLLKYALGLDPKQVVIAGLPVLGTTATDWTYKYHRPTDRVDLDYAIEVSSDLTHWSASGVSLELVDTDGVTDNWSARYPLTGNPILFFRLKVTRP